MADIIKYTTQSLSGTVGTLQTGNHFSYASFGSNADAVLKWKITNAGNGVTTYTQTLPSSITAITGTYTATVNTYAYFAYNSTYTVSNVATKTVEIRQHNEPVVSASSNAIWVGETDTITYTVTSNAFNKGVTVSVPSTTYGSFPSNTSSVTATPAVFTALGSTNRSTTGSPVIFTATSADPVGTASTKTVVTYQPITAIKLASNSTGANQITTLTINSGGSAVCYVAADAGTYTNTIARTYIQGKSSIIGTVKINNTTLTSTASDNITIAKSTGTFTTVTLDNVTAGGTVTFDTVVGPAGDATTSCYTKVTKTLTITVESIALAFYSDAACTKTMSSINPGDYFYAKVTGGSGNGTFSCTGGTVSTTSVSLSGGVTKVLVNSDAANNSNVTVTITPTNGTAASKNMSVKHITLTLV